jgi:hypothetical protein
MEYGTIGKDGTGSNVNPQDVHLRSATTESLYTSQIASWDFKNANQLKDKQNFPGLGDRDLLPTFQVGEAQPGYVSSHTRAPNTPPDFFAIAKRADGMPLEVIQYNADNTGHLTYKQQFLFNYQNLADGENRVTVQKWAPAAGDYSNAPKRTIGDQQNMLLGLSQYYRNGNDTVKAEYWTDASLTQPKPVVASGAPQPAGDWRTPDVRITFNDGTNSIGFQKKSLSGLLSGVIQETGDVAKSELTGVLPRFNFYDLFGPKL